MKKLQIILILVLLTIATASTVYISYKSKEDTTAKKSEAASLYYANFCGEGGNPTLIDTSRLDKSNRSVTLTLEPGKYALKNTGGAYKVSNQSLPWANRVMMTVLETGKEHVAGTNGYGSSSISMSDSGKGSDPKFFSIKEGWTLKNVSAHMEQGYKSGYVEFALVRCGADDRGDFANYIQCDQGKPVQIARETLSPTKKTKLFSLSAGDYAVFIEDGTYNASYGHAFKEYNGQKYWTSLIWARDTSTKSPKFYVWIGSWFSIDKEEALKKNQGSGESFSLKNPVEKFMFGIDSDTTSNEGSVTFQLYQCTEGGTPTYNPPECTSFTYSDWSNCVNNQQTREVISSNPKDCVGGNPVTTQSCNTSGGNESTSGKHEDATGESNATDAVCGNNICEEGEYIPCLPGTQCLWVGSCPEDCTNQGTDTVPKCSNGLTAGQCTRIGPVYCNENRELVESCQQCGCPQPSTPCTQQSCPQNVCQPDGSCKVEDTNQEQQAVICGPIDVDGDGRLLLVDLVAFADMFGSICSDAPPTTGCGGKDTNGDGKIDSQDFASFAKRFKKESCVIPQGSNRD